MPNPQKKAAATAIKTGQNQRPLQRSKDPQRERKYKVPKKEETQKMTIQLTLINPLT